MASRWFRRLSVDEKAIKFGLTKPNADLMVYRAPSPRRRSALASPRDRQNDLLPRVPRRHLLARPNDSGQVALDSVSVERLPSVPLGAPSGLAVQFEHAVENFAYSATERLQMRSPVRRVRIDDGIVAFEMTRIGVRKVHGIPSRTITLYFGVVTRDGSALQMARIAAADESTLRRQRAAVAAFLRRWVTVNRRERRVDFLSIAG